MKVEILREAGYEEALLGLSLNKRRGIMREPVSERQGRIERAAPVLARLAGKGRGHDKVMRMIRVWMLVEAPLFWWGHMDQYKVDKTDQDEIDIPDLIAGDDGEIVTSSESLMNTIPDLFTNDDFEYPLLDSELHELNIVVEVFKRGGMPIEELRNRIPQGVLQARELELNYATLENIVAARSNHRLSQWQTFIKEVLAQIQHPELLTHKKDL
jgi:hypothetical protein